MLSTREIDDLSFLLARWLNEGHWMIICQELGIPRTLVPDGVVLDERWRKTIREAASMPSQILSALFSLVAQRAPRVAEHPLFMATRSRIEKE